MSRTALDISGGSYESESLPFSAQRSVNWMPVVAEDKALSGMALFGAPGIKQFSNVTDTVARGCITMAGVPYFVIGNSLYSFASDGTATNHGTIERDGPVGMAHNGSKLAIVVPYGRGYVYDSATSTLSEITDPDYRPSSTVVFKDSYFVYGASDGSVLFVSNLNQPEVIDSSDFGSAEISPDLIVAVWEQRAELMVPGEETLERFQNVGGEAFPFQRIQGANSDKGLISAFGIANIDNSTVFIGASKEGKVGIWRVSTTSNPVKISTDAIDAKLQTYTKAELSQCVAKSYTFNGRMVADFTVRSADRPGVTLVYDATASRLAGRSMWSERQSGLSDGPWRANCVTKAYGKLLVGDDRSGLVGELDVNTYTEYGQEIYRSRTTVPFQNQGQSFFMGDIELTMESGVGLEDGSNPEVRMRQSDNGGRTFKDPLTRTIGKIGEHDRRTVWRRRGRIPAHRVLEFSMSDAVKANILKMEAVINGR